MRLIKVFLVGFLLVIGSAANAAQKIGVVDIRNAMFSSNAAREFSEALKNDYAKDEQEIKKVGEQAQKLQDRIKKDGAMMSDSERSKLVSDLEEKAKEFNYLKNKFESAVNKRKQDFLRESKPKLDQALVKVAKDNKVTILLPKEATIWVEDSLDLTQKLIDILNK